MTLFVATVAAASFVNLAVILVLRVLLEQHKGAAAAFSAFAAAATLSAESA